MNIAICGKTNPEFNCEDIMQTFFVGMHQFGNNYVNTKSYLINATALDTTAGVTHNLYDFLKGSKLIASMTTTKSRLEETAIAINTIMAQNVKANKVLLYLDEKLKNDPLPTVYSNLIKRGLEIKYVKDIGPATKILPAMKEFPNDFIISFDSDRFYVNRTIEMLLNSYLRNGVGVHGIIASNYGKQLYSLNLEKHYAPDLFPEGFGSVLYTPHIFDAEAFNEDVLMKYAAHHDDIWLYIQECRNHVKVYSAIDDYFGRMMTIDNNEIQDSGLGKNFNPTPDAWTNVFNDLRKHYGLE